MAVEVVEHVGLIGETVRIKGPNTQVLDSPGSASAGFALDGRVQHLWSSNAGIASQRLSKRPGIDSHATYQGRPVTHRTLVAVDASNLVEHYGYVAWEGRVSSLFADRVSLDPTAVGLDVMLGMLSAFTLVEHDHGLSVRPKGGRQIELATTGPPTVIKGLVGVGVLSVRGGPWASAAGLPGWRGTPVGNSEIYRGNVHDSGPNHPAEPYYVVVNDTLRGTLMPFRGVSDRAVFKELENLEIEWMSPAEAIWTTDIR